MRLKVKKPKKVNRKLVNKQYKEVLETILAGNQLFVRDTGIKVSVQRLHYEPNRYSNSNNYELEKVTCDIEFEDTPNYKALTKCRNYRIDGRDKHPPVPVGVTGSNQTSRGPEVTGSINVVDLSGQPYEDGIASKILFSKRNK